MAMFQDVEIVEENDRIIEISDDEVDNKNFFVIDDDVEETFAEVDITTCAVVPNEIELQFHDSSHAESSSNSASNNCGCFSVNNNSLEGVININNANIDIIRNSQVFELKREYNDLNTITTSNSHTSLEDNYYYSTNNSFSKGTKSQIVQTNNRKRKRLRGKNVIRGQCNKVSNESNSISNVETQNPTVLHQASCSSSNSGVSSNYDFSKLKWLKPLKNLSSPPNLQIVIVDRSHQDWKIPNDKWLMIEKRLLEALHNEMLRTNDASIGLFDGAKWQRGIKVVGCHNENAFDFVMKFIVNLDKLWHGAKLDAFPISHITRHVVRVYIPPPTLKTELIMSLIKLQNPSLCSKDWKLVKERERAENGGLDIWISVNEESFIELSRLRGEVKYGINRIFVNPTHYIN